MYRNVTYLLVYKQWVSVLRDYLFFLTKKDLLINNQEICDIYLQLLYKIIFHFDQIDSLIQNIDPDHLKQKKNKSNFLGN
jgi:hypothetical protein